MPAIQVIIENNKVIKMNAGGGDAGELVNEDLIEMFGNDKVLIILDKFSFKDFIKNFPSMVRFLGGDK